MAENDEFQQVGPVLQSGAISQVVLEAIRSLNPEVWIEDRGGYYRVSCKSRCSLTRKAVEERLGREFRMPQDLENIMPSFQGRLRINEEEAEWLL